MLVRFLSIIAAVFFLAGAQSAYSIMDEYSTGPGQGVPDQFDDVWQSVFNGWGLVPSADEDNDGCSNLVESLAGSDPRNPSDCFTIGNMVIGGTNIIFNFDAQKGKRYQVWQSDSPAGGSSGAGWIAVPGAEKVATIEGSDTIIFAKPSNARKFYRLEATDVDADGDGISDWSEYKVGSNPNAATSADNASGGTASDLDTLKSLLSLTATPGVTTAYEKEGTMATVRLQRSVGTMALTVGLGADVGTEDPTKSSAVTTDFVFRNMADVMTNTVTLPAGQGVSSPFQVAKVSAVADTQPEVPELLQVCIKASAAADGPICASTTVKISDANPADTANRTLYVAYLGREADAISTASGYATALVNGDNTNASITVVFNNLSSEQNTAYIRYGPNNDLAPALPNGQVSGFNYNVAYKPGFLSSDQAFLTALGNGSLGCAVSSADYPDKELFGFFNKVVGSVNFNANNDDLVAPALGSASWQAPTADALEREIWRFMGQATFGGTTALYNEIRAECDAAIAGGGNYIQGLSSWLDKQMDINQTPQISLQQLMIAADMEEFALRGNKPITYNSDPQLNGGSIPVTYVNGMPMASATNPDTNSPGNNNPSGGNGDSPNRRREWWTMILQSKDQVRQRVALALHEICVISERDATVNAWGYGAANYWDMLASGAFGKYRTLLEQVSLNPMMGVYLTSVANRAAYDAGGGLIISPDENYAREIMQLFSIGLVLRHPDGSLQLDSEGLPIATYDNTDITSLARVFTGFSFGARHGNATTQVLGQYGSVSSTTQRISPTVYLNGTPNNIWFGRDNGHPYWQAAWTYPMRTMGRIGTIIYHDFKEKTLLAGKHGEYYLPAQAVTTTSPSADTAVHNLAAIEVSRAHDVLAGSAAASTYGDGSAGNPGHTNTPVNMSRWLIQRLVTSNPSAGYIYRVQKVYRENNGLLGPVIKAILLDWEARSLQLADTSISFGKVKEPLIHFASILRQFRAFSGAPVSLLRDMNTGFSDLDAPMTGGYPASEHAKFSFANANPPSKPTGWPDGPFRIRIDSLRSSLGQSPQDAPSVFNWFLPDFVVPGNMAQAGLFAPELQIATEAAEVSKLNLLYNYTWMTLAGMSSQPGVSGANFIFRNAWATPAVRFSTNGGTSLMGWPATITLNETNWNTGVTVTMVGVNDQRMNTLASSAVRYAVSGAATGYSGVATQATPVSFVDNEVKNEQLVITPTGGNTWIQEGGNTDVFSVMLSAPPSTGSAVNIALTAQNGEVTLSAATLSFTDSNWNAPQNVTVTAVDDSDVEDTGTGNDLISFITTSDAANYHGIVTAPHAVNVVDNDNALGVLITQTGGTTDVAETSSSTISPLSAGLDTYSIVLTKAPTASVTVNCTGNGLQVNQTPTSTTFATTYTRVFTTANWNVPQIVVVRGNNDTTSEGPHTGTVSHTISAAAGGYATTLPIQQIVATIVDDDNSIILAHSGFETRVMEGGDVNDTMTVRLRINPNAEVSLTLGGNGLKFTPAQLTFKPTGSADSLWSADQTVTVSALDDYLNEGLLVSNVTAYTNSAGSNYNGSSAPLLPVTIIDNDDARLVVTESGDSTLVNEDGTNDTYTLALSSRPDVGSTTTVSLSPSTTGIQVTPAGPFVFNESNWNTAVTVTVSTTNDGTAETRGTATISHTIVSTDPVYNRSTSPVLLVTIDDNDPPLTIAQSNIFTQVREAGTAGTGGTPNVSDTFTVLLPRAPATGTTVTVTLNPSSQITVSPSVLTFTSSSTGVGAFATAQTVTVTAVDDADVEAPLHAGSVGFRLVSTDSYFNGLAAPPVMVQVTDNDGPGLSIVESSNTTAVTEGSGTTDSYTVVLTRVPTGNVDVVIDGGTQSRLSKTSTVGAATTTTLNFTPANWSTAQTVWVLPVDDTVAELRHLSPITHSISAGSAVEYQALTGLPSVSAIITDNDNNVAANVVRISESSGSTAVTESGATVNGISSNSDTITVVLSQAPTSNVTVTFPPNGQLMATPSTITFIPGATGTGTFNVAQTVTIRSVDDKVMEPILHWGQIVPTVSSADAFFNGKTVTPIISSIYDNDGPSVNVQITAASTVLTENGVTDTYTVALSSEPTTDVTVTLAPDAQLTANVSSLLFTTSLGASPWNVPQTVTLTAVNDTTAETVTHTGIVTHAVSSTDPLYSNLSVPTLAAQIWDNDVPSIDVSHAGADSSNTVVTEGGVNDAILIKLNTQPEPGTSVTITLYPPAYFVPPPQIAKTQSYFINDQGSSNERDNIVIDYSESIQLYRDTFYSNLRAAYGGVIPSPFPTTPSAADNIRLQNAHWAATKAIIDKMDIWFSGGGMKARNPILIEPNQPLPVPRPQSNPRQAIMDAIYAHSGGSNLPATTRYTPEVTFNPKSPPTDTFANDVRDRCRWAGYLMTVGAPGLVSH
jgi:hypothetical protein